MKRSSLLKKCKEKLIELKNNYENILMSEQEKTAKNSTEIIDMAIDEQITHSSIAHKQRIGLILPEIKFALQRIEQGTYGSCEITGENIGPKRLLAVPWTRVSMKAIELQS